eukprot:TRINITY_DN20312_c0_g2_i1.p1 TRINITY_DN20312_c0_g2~~TRINITY_DN20312_c0_g2_i1.p1  ORF type:complete len:4570 (-),score=1248.97 TRINITY_DN20312_c0_g2_i1:75-13784(-)
MAGLVPAPVHGRRQRGIYSEVLVAREDGDAGAAVAGGLGGGHGGGGTPMGLEEGFAHALAGPTKAKDLCGSLEARPASASRSFTQRNRIAAQIKPPEAYHRLIGVDPKVCEEHRTRPGRPPRRVRVERLRRQYEAQDVVGLLKLRGVDYSDPAFEGKASLPLEPFDDSEYDCRTPTEWLQQGWRDGQFYPLKARALRFDLQNLGHWYRALIYGYDTKLCRFEIHWDEEGMEDLTPEFLPRLRVLICGEDPAVFADRVAQAHNARRTAEALIRYNFFIDNMPTDGVPQLNADQCERLLEAVSTSSRSGKNEDLADQDVAAVLQEVQLDFARTMNRITFDIFLHESKDSDPMQAGLEMAKKQSTISNAYNGKPPCTDVPYQGLVPIPPHAFAETFASLCFCTLRVRSEVVLALQGIKAACEKVALEERVYSTHFRKPLRLEEFKQIQRAATGQASLQLRESWSWSMHQTVLREFANVGKGWFNINETNYDLYQRGKLKRFLTLVRFIMQTTVHEIGENSVHEFVAAVNALTPEKVDVESLSDVHCTFRDAHLYRPSQAGAAAQAKVAGQPGEEEGYARPGSALFAIEIIRRDAAADVGHGSVRGVSSRSPFTLSVDPHKFVTATLEAFDIGLASLSEVQTIERLVLPQMAKSQVSTPLLTGVDAKEPWIVEARKQVGAKIKSTLPPLDQFLRLLRKYDHLVSRDAGAYVAAFMGRRDEKGPPSDEEVQEAIQRELRAERELQLELPEVAQVGVFQVGCKDIRRLLASRHSSVVERLLEALLVRLVEQVDETLDSFTALGCSLRKRPKNVEELVDMKHFAESAPRQVALLRERIANDVQLFERFESFNYKLSLDVMRKRWQLAGAPKALMDAVARTLRSLQQCSNDFLAQLLSAQEDFDETLADIDATVDLFRDRAQYRALSGRDHAFEIVENVKERIANASRQIAIFHAHEAILGRPCSDYGRLQLSINRFEPYKVLWTVVKAWMDNCDAWKSGPLTEVDPRVVEQEVFRGTDQLEKVRQALSDPEKGVVIAPDDALLEICDSVRNALMDFRPLVPVIVALRTKGTCKRHWDEISEVLDRPVSPEMEDFTLEVLTSEHYKIQDHRSQLEAIVGRAAEEAAIEEQLSKMREALETASLDCSDKAGVIGTWILQNVEPIVVLLDEQLVETQVLQFSPYVEPLLPDVTGWVTKLRYMMDCLEEWRKCQTSWLYLQPIFDSADITRQLPAESRRFKAVDSLWRSIMKVTHENPKVLPCLSRDGLLERWVDANSNMEAVSRSLEDFLETKRSAFARFYFVSNAELLKLISKTRNPTFMQPFLGHCFEGIGELCFTADLCVIAMVAPEGEKIAMPAPVTTQGNTVEVWMRGVELGMYAGIQSVVNDAVADYDGSSLRCDWLSDHPVQSVLSASQVHWTFQVEAALLGGIEVKQEPAVLLLEVYNQLEQQLHDLLAHFTWTVRNSKAHLEVSQGFMLSALITLDVHQRDVVAALVKAQIGEIGAFEWVSQLRYAWSSSDRAPDEDLPGLTLRCLHASLPYGCEYQGASPTRLTVTPLTDRCRAVLLNAASVNLGAVIAGPSGSGKTETVKDLCRTVAKRCVVFNCSEGAGIDRTAASYILKGLAVSGLWCCLDDVDRLGLELLCLMAQQFRLLFAAKAEITHWTGTLEVLFDGTPINVCATFGAIATMGLSQGATQPLPATLRALFRPICMTMPDVCLACEMSLLSNGFLNSNALARKVTTTLRIASEQLSSQGHYDFGLRTMRSIVAVAGQLHQDAIAADKPGPKDAKGQVAPSRSTSGALMGRTSSMVTRQNSYASSRKASGTKEEAATFEDSLREQAPEEEAEVFRALCDVLFPPLLDEDEKLLHDILVDIFPNYERRHPEKPALQAQLAKACEAQHLQNLPTFVGKAVELHGAMHARSGTALVGNTGAGKSCLLRVLQQALCSLQRAEGKSREAQSRALQVHTMNPKALSLQQLLGELDSKGQWRDGVLATLLRSASAAHQTALHPSSSSLSQTNLPPPPRWIVLDGPIDGGWADGFSSMLDENRRLCLHTGDFVRVAPQVSFLFEGDSLAGASPAFVARCGCVHVDASTVGPEALWTTWLQRVPARFDSLKQRLKTLVLNMLPSCLDFVTGQEALCVLPLTDIGLTECFLGLMDAQFTPFLKAAGVQTNNAATAEPNAANAAAKNEAQASASQTLPQRHLELSVHLDSVFLYALTWSLGGAMDALSRQRYSLFLRQQATKNHMDLRAFEGKGTIFERAYNLDTGSWSAWLKKSILDEEPEEQIEVECEELFVPTVATQQAAGLLKVMLWGSGGKRHVVIAGPLGSGKSTAVRNFLASRSTDEMSQAQGGLSEASLVMSPLSSAEQIQDALDSKLEVRGRGTYGPPPGSMCAFFVDDMNMPIGDERGEHPTTHLLLHWLDHEGWYRRQDGSFRKIVDVFMVGAMTVGIGNKGLPATRLLRRLQGLAMPEPPEASLVALFAERFEHLMVDRQDIFLDDLALRIASITFSLLAGLRKNLVDSPHRVLKSLSPHEVMKMLQGLSLCTARYFTEKADLVRAWCYEGFRVFGDRVPFMSDRNALSALLTDCAKQLHKGFAQDIKVDAPDVVFSHVLPYIEEGSLASRRSTVGDSDYGEVEDLEAFQEVLQGWAEAYVESQNRHSLEKSQSPKSRREMHTTQVLTMFKEFVVHLARVARVLMQPHGHCLLVGLAGCGKQSVATLASFVCGRRQWRGDTAAEESSEAWRSLLKACLTKAGCDVAPQSLILTDKKTYPEKVLDDVGRIMSSGDIPELYGTSDLELIMRACVSNGQERGIQTTLSSALRVYSARVREYAHVILCLNNASPAFRPMLRKFPTIVSHSTANWMQRWPNAAWHAIAKRQFEQGVLDDMVPDEGREHFFPAVAAMHMMGLEAVGVFAGKSSRQPYVLPGTALGDFVLIYRAGLKREKELRTARQELLAGASTKLENAMLLIDIMRVHMEELTPKLDAVLSNIEELSQTKDTESQGTDSIRLKLEQLQKEAQEHTNQAREYSDAAEREMMQVTPQLDAAVDFLKNLAPNAIRDIRLMTKPSIGIVLTMTVVCMFLGVPPVRKPGPKPGTRVDDYWEVVHTTLLKDGKKFLDDLFAFDKETALTDELIVKVKPFLERDEFDPFLIRRYSIGAEAICAWVRAVVRYAEQTRVAEPLRVKMRKELELLKAVQLKVDIHQVREQEAGCVIDQVNDRIAKQSEKKADLEQKLHVCERKIERAKKLTRGHGKDRQEWSQTAKHLLESLEALPGDCAFCAALTTYGSCLDYENRARLSESFLKVLTESPLQSSGSKLALQTTFGNQLRMLEWQSCGLPQDGFAIDNCIMMDVAHRWPLIIDPQRQANEFLKRFARSPHGAGKDEHFEVVRQSDPNYTIVLEEALENGVWVLLEMSSIHSDFAFDDFPQKQPWQAKAKDDTAAPASFVRGISDSSQAQSSSIHGLVERAISAEDADGRASNVPFNLFMTTIDPFPNLPVQLLQKVWVVNFAITASGLEWSIRNAVARAEKPELEERRLESHNLELRLRRDMREYEDAILNMLSTTGPQPTLHAEWDILADEDVSESLNSTRVNYDSTAKRVSEVQVANEEVERQFRAFASLAARAKPLVFTLMDLARLGPLYRFSVPWLLTQCLLPRQASDMLVPSNELLQQTVQDAPLTLYHLVAPALAPDVKLTFAFLLCVRLKEAEEDVDPAELRFITAPMQANEDKWHWEESADNIEGAHQEQDEFLDYMSQKVKAAELVQAEVLAETQFREQRRHARHEERTAFVKRALQRAADELEVLDCFVEWAAQVRESGGWQWRPYYESLEPEVTPLPGEWQDKFTELQRICLLRALRPDRVPQAIDNFVIQALFRQNAALADGPVNPMADCFKASEASSPILVLLAEGGPDASSDIHALARLLSLDSGLRDVSLSAGQEARAEKIVKEAAVGGGWALLANCHLRGAWLPALEALFDGLQRAGAHADFRLWLTLEPMDEFPATLLEHAVRITNAPPKGLRANLLQAYARSEDDALDGARGCSVDLSGSPAGRGWKRFSSPGSQSDGQLLDDVKRRLVFGLCFAHAVFLDRHHFGHVGWAQASGLCFLDEDLAVARRQVKDAFLALEKDENTSIISVIPYKLICYTVAEVHYMGRVQQHQDLQTLRAVVHRYVCREVAEGCDAGCFDLEGRVYLPTTDIKDECLQELQYSLPAVFHADAYGVHPSVHLRADEAVAKQLMHVLTQVSGAGDKTQAPAGRRHSMCGLKEDTRDAVIKQLDAMHHELPGPIDEAAMRHQCHFLEPMNSVGLREVYRYNQLLGVIQADIDSLRAALQGRSQMTDRLEELADELFKGRVPAAWLKSGYVSELPLIDWSKDLRERVKLFKKWASRERPKSLWLGVFMSIHCFLTGVLQTMARKKESTIDKWQHSFHVTQVTDLQTELDKEAEDGFLTYGWYLEGCDWCRHRRELVPAARPHKYTTLMPMIWALPKLQRERTTMGCAIVEALQAIYTTPGILEEEDRSRHSFEAPLYRMSSRSDSGARRGPHSNFILEVRLPASEPPEVYAAAGAALLLTEPHHH